MTTPAFSFTDEAAPIVQIGLGDTRVPVGTGVWNTSVWDGAAAKWGGLEPAWLDVSCYTHELECNSGRERFTDRFQPGTATVTFTNANGWADLAGTPGQVAALSLRPGRAVRIGVEIAACGICWLWRGVIDSMTPDYDPVVHDIVTINCIDVLAEVGSTKLAELAPDGADELVHVRLGRILDATKWEATKRILAVSTTKVIQTVLGAQAIDLLGVTADSGGGVVYGDLDGNVVYKNSGWQNFPVGTPPDGVIGNVVKTVPGTPGVINPPYLHVLGPPVSDVSTPDAGSLALPNAFTVFTTVQHPLGGAAGAVGVLAGQWDGSQREWVITRDADDGDWCFGTSADGIVAPPLPPFAHNGATPITGGTEKFALSVKLDDGIGTTRAALVAATGYASTPDQPTFTPPATLYAFGLIRCDDIDAAGNHTICGQGGGTGATDISWAFQINAGAPQFRVSANGTAVLNYPICTAPQLATVLFDGQDQYLGASIQFTTTPGNARCALLTSANGINWVERFSTSVSSAVGAPFNSAAPITVGARGDGSNRWNGRIYWARGYHDGITEADVRWWFDGDDNVADDTATTYTDPRGLVWTLTSAAAIDRLAVMQTTSLQIFKPNPYASGARWLAVDAPQQIPKLPHFDRTSPVRIGRYETGGQEWPGNIYNVSLVDGANPNLPGQPIWKMDLAENTGNATTWTDPRGRVWTVNFPRWMTAYAGNYSPPATPDPGVPPSIRTFVMRLRHDTRVPNQDTIASQFTSSPQLSWVLARDATTGSFVYSIYPNGTGTGVTTRTSIVGAYTLGDEFLALTIQDNNGSGRSIHTVWKSTDGVTWTSQGAVDVGATVVPFDSNAVVRVGAVIANTNPFRGRIYWVECRDGATPTAGTVQWRFDANENTAGTAAFTDARSRTWTASSANVYAGVPITDPPDVAAIAAVPGDVCPVGWENSFDRAEISTQIMINRVLPATIPVLQYNITSAVEAPPAGQIRMNNADQQAATQLWISAGASAGVQATPYLRNLIAGSIVKLSDVGDVTNNTRTYRVTGTATASTGYWIVPVVWTEGLTGVGGIVELTMSIVGPAPYVLDDQTGQTLYGVETFELLDLISTDSTLFPTLATRLLATQGYTSMPRIEAVTLAAESGDVNTMLLMAQCRPELPSRYRCRLLKDRMIFDREMFCTGVRHFMSRDSWTLRIALDVAAWAAV